MFCITSLAYLYIGPYKDKMANVLEATFSLCTTLLYLLSLTRIDQPIWYLFLQLYSDERDGCLVQTIINAPDIVQGILYYLPLLISVIAVCVYSRYARLIVIMAYMYYTTKYICMMILFKQAYQTTCTYNVVSMGLEHVPSACTCIVQFCHVSLVLQKQFFFILMITCTYN